METEVAENPKRFKSFDEAFADMQAEGRIPADTTLDAPEEESGEEVAHEANEQEGQVEATEPDQPAEQEQGEEGEADTGGEPEESTEGEESEEEPEVADADLPEDLFGEKKEDESEEEEEEEPLTDEKDSERYKRRLEKAKERGKKEAAKEYEAKLKELQEQLEQKQDAPELSDEEKKELLQYRRRYGLERDPTVQEKFEKPLKRNNETAKSILLKYGNEDIKAQLERVDDVATWAYEDPRSFKEVVEIIEEDNAVDGERLKTAVLSNLNLADEKKSYIEEQSRDAEEFFKKQEQEQSQLTEEQKKQQEAFRQEFTQKVSKVLESKYYADTPVEGLEGEAKEKAKAENKVKAKMRERFLNSLKSLKDGPDAAMRVAAENSYAIKYYNDLQVLKKENERLNSLLKKKQGAGKVASNDAPEKGRGPSAEPVKGREVDTKAIGLDLIDMVQEGKVIQKGKKYFWA